MSIDGRNLDEIADEVANAAALLPVWNIFEHDYVVPGVPVYVVVRERPVVRLFVDADGRRIGARLELADGAALPQSPLAEIVVDEVLDHGIRFIEISTATHGLFAHFYALITDVIERVVKDQVHPLAALGQSLSRWQALLRTLTLLTNEQQLGLLGELWVVQRLLTRLKADVLASWVGPDRQSHDFRVGDDELEVKVTTTTHRSHIINGLTQLMASPGCRLYIVSLQLAPAGVAGGWSLPEVATSIRDSLSPWPASKDRFITILEQRLRFRFSDAGYYPQRWRMRTRPHLVPVGVGCPRLVPDALSHVPKEYAMQRVSDISYRVDLEGLGFPEDHPDFIAVLPPAEQKTTGGSAA